MQRLCEEDGTLIKDLKPKWIKYINEWKNNQSFEPSFFVEYYGIRWDKIEKEYEKIYNNKIYAGIYVKLGKDEYTREYVIK